MSRFKSLTKAEEEIMQLIWQIGRCTVSNIIEELPSPKPPHSSISSIVRILERKGFVGHKAYGRTYEYFPMILKEVYSKRSLLSFLKDYFDGSTPQLVSFLIEQEETSVEELQDLIKQLKKKKS
ncbi:MAG: BlaI/MecI/CopY family transcriptional regulator [Saprospiraceae bacterium]